MCSGFSNPIGLGKRGGDCNILVIKCIRGVEFSRITVIAFKTIVKLRFGVSITPKLGNPR
jgi:hypothetical protein